MQLRKKLMIIPAILLLAGLGTATIYLTRLAPDTDAGAFQTPAASSPTGIQAVGAGGVKSIETKWAEEKVVITTFNSGDILRDYFGANGRRTNSELINGQTGHIQLKTTFASDGETVLLKRSYRADGSLESNTTYFNRLVETRTYREDGLFVVRLETNSSKPTLISEQTFREDGTLFSYAKPTQQAKTRLHFLNERNQEIADGLIGSDGEQNIKLLRWNNTPEAIYRALKSGARELIILDYSDNITQHVVWNTEGGYTQSFFGDDDTAEATTILDYTTKHRIKFKQKWGCQKPLTGSAAPKSGAVSQTAPLSTSAGDAALAPACRWVLEEVVEYSESGALTELRRVEFDKVTGTVKRDLVYRAEGITEIKYFGSDGKVQRIETVDSDGTIVSTVPANQEVRLEIDEDLLKLDDLEDPQDKLKLPKLGAKKSG